jgi:hypothetical protein
MIPPALGNGEYPLNSNGTAANTLTGAVVNPTDGHNSRGRFAKDNSGRPPRHRNTAPSLTGSNGGISVAATVPATAGELRHHSPPRFAVATSGPGSTSRHHNGPRSPPGCVGENTAARTGTASRPTLVRSSPGSRSSDGGLPTTYQGQVVLVRVAPPRAPARRSPAPWSPGAIDETGKTSEELLELR